MAKTIRELSKRCVCGGKWKYTANRSHYIYKNITGIEFSKINTSEEITSYKINSISKNKYRTPTIYMADCYSYKHDDSYYYFTRERLRAIRGIGVFEKHAFDSKNKDTLLFLCTKCGSCMWVGKNSYIEILTKQKKYTRY